VVPTSDTGLWKRLIDELQRDAAAPHLKCVYYTYMVAARAGQCDGSDAWTTKKYQNQLWGGWCDGGGIDTGQHFAAQERIDTPLSPINPFQRYPGRNLGGQSVCDGRGGAVHRANMVVMERRKLSKNSGLTRTTFSSLKKVIASPPLHHSVVSDYCEDMVPRSFDCCQ